jgi:hypothetical protein
MSDQPSHNHNTNPTQPTTYQSTSQPASSVIPPPPAPRPQPRTPNTPSQPTPTPRSVRPVSQPPLARFTKPSTRPPGQAIPESEQNDKLPRHLCCACHVCCARVCNTRRPGVGRFRVREGQTTSHRIASCRTGLFFSHSLTHSLVRHAHSLSIPCSAGSGLEVRFHVPVADQIGIVPSKPVPHIHALHSPTIARCDVYELRKYGHTIAAARSTK